jgi:hypothetical protein
MKVCILNEALRAYDSSRVARTFCDSPPNRPGKGRVRETFLLPRRGWHLADETKARKDMKKREKT